MRIIMSEFGDVDDRSRLTTPTWFQELIIEDAIDKTVIEVGCGTGALVSELNDISDEVFGCDISRERLSVAKKRMTNVFEASGADLPVETSSVDVAISIEVIEHVQDSQSILEKFYRVLKQDGVLYLKTPNRWTHDAYQVLHNQLKDSREWHPNLYTHRKFTREVQGLFTVKFLKSNPASYQIEKVKNASSIVGRLIEQINFDRLPRFIQPSIYARCTPVQNDQ